MGQVLRVFLTTIVLLLGVAQQGYTEITWNGFISVGGGIADPDDSDMLDNYEDDFSFEQNTKLGLQLRAPISDKLSATGQMIARGSDDYQMEMAWAYLSYQASETTTVRFGRFRTPFFLYSDFLDVGYAYHWVSPPIAVYGAVPVDSIDGFDVVYQTPLGPTDFTAQFYGGSAKNDFVNRGQEITAELKNHSGLALTLNYDWLTVRMSHHETQEVSFRGFENVFLAPTIGTIADLQATLNALGAVPGGEGYALAAENLTIEDQKFTFDEVALKMEWQNFLFVVEKTRLFSKTGPTGDQKHMYYSLGYTVGPVTLHVTQSKTDDDLALLPSLVPAGVPDAITSASLAGALESIALSFIDPDRTTNTFGIRWDFDPSAAFKLEFSEVSDDIRTEGTIIRFSIDSVF